VLYEMLTMQRPFRGESREDLLHSVLTKEPRSPRRINGKIPVDMETICLKALEKDPERRYATAGWRRIRSGGTRRRGNWRAT
jgi:serine/threonine-protein kinase